MLSSVAGYVSYVPMPTVSQAAAGATAALVCKELFRKIGAALVPESNLKKGNLYMIGPGAPESPLRKGAFRMVHASIFVLGKIGFVTLLAAAQKKFPLTSRVGIVVLTPFILKDSVSVIKGKSPSENVRSMADLGAFINLVVTGVLFYQNRSRFTALHFATNIANIASLFLKTA